MTKTNVLRLLAFAPGLFAAPAAFAGLLVNPAVDVIGNVSLADFTNNGYGTNTYKGAHPVVPG
jgi:hypothetical protein